MSASIYRSSEGRARLMALYDRVLARWPVPREERRVPTRHGQTFAIASGPAGAPALVLLHGACSNAVSWVGEAQALSAGHRVFAVDLPGEPGRSDEVRPPWQGPAFTEWLEDLLDGLGLARASLMGLSQGAWHALKLATARPERVERLVLVAPGGVVAARGSFLLRAILLSILGRRGAERLNRYVLGGDALPQEAVEFMEAILTHFHPRIGKQPLFTDEELGRLSMPVLFVAGGRDVIFDSRASLERLRQRVPHLEAVLRPEAGHALTDLAPEVLPFLARHPQAGAA